MFHIIFVVDRSGSMYGKEEELTMGIHRIAKENPKACFTITQFDNEIETVLNRQKSSKVKKFKLEPRAATAMYDGIAEGLSHIDKDDDKTLVVIITDGAENSSTTWKKEHITALIGAHSAEYMFLGAGIDAFEEGYSMGISNSIQLNANDSTTFSAAMDLTSSATLSFSSGHSMTDAIEIGHNSLGADCSNSISISPDVKSRRKGSSKKVSMSSWLSGS